MQRKFFAYNIKHKELLCNSEKVLFTLSLSGDNVSRVSRLNVDKDIHLFVYFPLSLTNLFDEGECLNC